MRTIVALAAVASAALLAVASPSVPRAGAWSPASAALATYYGCDANFSMQRNGDYVRCYRGPYETYGSMNACPNIGGVGFFLRQDKSGDKDMCVGINPVTGETMIDATCATGYTKRVRDGADQCYKSNPSEVRAPAKPVTV